MEEVLEATSNRPPNKSRIKKGSKFVKGFRVCTNKINLEERVHCKNDAKLEHQNSESSTFLEEPESKTKISEKQLIS